jgi:hypothetical protein
MEFSHVGSPQFWTVVDSIMTLKENDNGILMDNKITRIGYWNFPKQSLQDHVAFLLRWFHDLQRWSILDLLSV